MIERRFDRSFDALAGIFEFVQVFFATNGLPGDQTMEVDLILEELFTNMVRHARGGGEQIAIGLDWDGSTLTLILRDFDVEGFDVTVEPSTHLDRPLTERGAGGMGLLLVHRLADSLRYDYAGRTSTITVTKRLES